MRQRAFTLDGTTVEPGHRKEMKLPVSESYTAAPVHAPLTVLHGARPGPRLFVTAAVHGDELNGVEVVRRLSLAIVPERLAGTVILVPVLNPFGMFALSRYLPDGTDLNRYFPGSPDGNVAAQMAHALFTKVLTLCDYGIDLHTATRGRTNLPHVRADLSDPGTARLARAFGAEVVFDFPGHEKSLRAAAVRHGIPTIVFEAGESLKFQRKYVQRGVRGVQNVLRAFDMYDAPRRRPAFRVRVRHSVWVRAPRGGILMMHCRPGAVVRRGDNLATSTRPFGRDVSAIPAPCDGLVVSTTNIPMVHPGTAVCHIVRLGRRLAAVEAALAVARARADRRDADRRDADRRDAGNPVPRS
ncbi:MAG: succinylglutamate desuccinylase/aspartoacylase family protein [Planctomycetes bacterium]|nr:succinylglutamate desuccinylase/aspartoacylase family protein [Planctomycetota bacterium]